MQFLALATLIGARVSSSARPLLSPGSPVLITPASVLLALCFSAAVGVFFGLYPVLKAARLDPVQALRF